MGSVFLDFGRFNDRSPCLFIKVYLNYLVDLISILMILTNLTVLVLNDVLGFSSFFGPFIILSTNLSLVGLEVALLLIKVWSI